MDLEIWREIGEMQQARHLLRQRYLERDDVLFWRMPAFLGDEKEFDRIVEIARRHKSLVLDLRGNGGGSPALTERLIGSVVDHDVTIGMRVTRAGRKPVIAKSRRKDLFTGKLIVLVDSESASASEVFSRMMQLERRGTVIGDRSSGSVMEAATFRFEDYSGVIVTYGAAITIADLTMADGNRLEKVGVTPDVLMLPTASQLAHGEDPALAKAAELVGIKLDPVEAGKMFPFEWAK